MFPVIAMCGQRCGLHITATTAICALHPSAAEPCARRRDRDGTHAAGGADGAGAQVGEERLLVVVRDRADDVDEAGDAAVAELLGEAGAELVERDGLAGVVGADELGGDAGGDAQELLGLRGAWWSHEGWGYTSGDLVHRRFSYAAPSGTGRDAISSASDKAQGWEGERGRMVRRGRPQNVEWMAAGRGWH